MNRYGKEIMIGLLATILTGLAIFYYSNRLQAGRLAENTDWHTYIADHPYALLQINRPSVVTSLVFSDTITKNIFRKYLPAPAIQIITTKNPALPLYISFHTNGELLYIKASEQQFNKLHNEVLNSYFKFYQPETEMIEAIKVEFYPAGGNRFFGSFYHQGMWVGSFSRKLLEESIRHMASSSPVAKETNKSFDPNSPLNLFLVSDSIRQYMESNFISEQVKWDKWMVADIFVNEQSLCFFTQTPDIPETDSIRACYLHAMDTYLSGIAQRPVQGELSTNEENTYYSSCLPLLFP
ncbi:MAG: hypothetical protein LUD02_12500 [Tannerellaceae bacterium]|nr:hypothetical protein [Tannerellaceae bacterium]MCD8264859.1 hypothetical protein [Tannerellaceae bacterium]